MERKKPEEMSREELVRLITWYETRLKYARFLLSEVK